MTPQERQELTALRNELNELKQTSSNALDLLDAIKYPSFWEFRQPVIINTLRLPNLSTDPATTIAGELAVVAGELKIYTGSAWVVVGTQT